MRTNTTYSFSFFSTCRCIVLLLCLAVGIGSCKREHLPTVSTGGHDYTQINLVADSTGYGAARVDHNLSNPWGMAVSTKGTIWICCNHSGQCLTVDNNGTQLYSPVATPYDGNRNGASPNGIVFNNTYDFVVGTRPVYCICSSEEGILTAWVSGDSTVTVANRSSYGSTYKGITIANNGTENYIYAADFFNGKIDVYDNAFHYVVGKHFSDPNMPAGFAQFNIMNINGRLFVTYAKQMGPDKHNDQAGVGNGYVDIFDADGNLIKRFASQGTLNSPWGIAQAPADFGQLPNAILISNYGDGRITVFDSTGTYQGLISNNGTPLTVDGLWDITFVSNTSGRLYFTSGPANKMHGLFGYIQVK